VAGQRVVVAAEQRMAVAGIGSRRFVMFLVDCEI